MSQKTKFNLKKIKTLAELKNIFFESLDENFYEIFKGSQTDQVLKNGRGIDSITIDNLIYLSLFGIADKDFQGKLFNYEKRKKSFEERENFGLSFYRQSFGDISVNEEFNILINAFFVFPDGSPHKVEAMVSILELFYRTNIHEIENNFFLGYDKDFYSIFGINSFETISKGRKSLDKIDSVTIDTYVYEALYRSHPKSYSSFGNINSLNPQREKIFNLRKKISMKQLSTAFNFLKKNRMNALLDTFMIAPKWSYEKDKIIIAILNNYFDLVVKGKRKPILENNF